MNITLNLINPALAESWKILDPDGGHAKLHDSFIRVVAQKLISVKGVGPSASALVTSISELSHNFLVGDVAYVNVTVEEPPLHVQFQVLNRQGKFSIGRKGGSVLPL